MLVTDMQLCNAVDEDTLSLLTGHVTNSSSALRPFYIAKDGALGVLMLMAGFGEGLDYKDFRCNKHYIQGRHLFTSAAIQSTYPDIWARISAQLLPGLDDLLSALQGKPITSRKDEEELAIAQFCFELREAFVQDSAWHFFDPVHAPVYAGLSLYRDQVFLQWLSQTFRPRLEQLQTESEAVSKYICGSFHDSGSLLDRSLEALGMGKASTAEQSTRLLHEMHRHMLKDKERFGDSTDDQHAQRQQQELFPPLIPAAALVNSIHVPVLRGYGCGEELLLKMYSAWHQGNPQLGITPLKDTHSVGCPDYMGAYYGGKDAEKHTRSFLANNKAMLRFFYDQVQRKAASIKARSSEKMGIAAKQIAKEWWDLIQQHPDMKTVADMARCCRQVVAKTKRASVETHVGKTCKKRDAEGNELQKQVKTMATPAFCQYFALQSDT